MNCIKFLPVVGLLVVGHKLVAQQMLNIKKYADCELFRRKDNYNKAERLKMINNMEGKNVTFF